jgi:hypothetical protein
LISIVKPKDLLWLFDKDNEFYIEGDIITIDDFQKLGKNGPELQQDIL